MKYDVVVIGGGVVGLATAYHLAKKGIKGAVFEKGYVGCGSTTRSASRFRVHFWSEENTRFAIESRKRMLSLAKMTKWNPLPITGGYLWVIYDEDVMRAYKTNNDTLWSKLGVAGRLMEREEVKEMYPYLNLEGVIGAFYGPQDGQVHHDFVTYGYCSAAMRNGFEVYEGADVQSIMVSGSSVAGVSVNGKVVKAKRVVVCAGAWSNNILSSAGVQLPMVPERKELCVTEPFKRRIEPLIINTKRNFYVGQSIRGEIMGSVEYPEVRGFVELRNTLKWAARFSRALVEMIPSLRYARMMRMWSGYYEVTPDHSHILGRDPDWPDGLYVGTGFSGHGFMMAPFAGEVLADYVAEDRVHPLMKPYLPTRFKEGREIKETMVIG
ncbi:MAG: NAD(P)/FAD-dependent oxidoreductase [Candidatus Methanodesulfokora sp.]